MSRLDDLLALRRQLDVEIQQERAATERAEKLRALVLTATTRGTWNQRVLAAVCAYTKVSAAAIYDGRRDRATVEARQTVMWLLRDSGRSYPEIGTALDIDHTTAMHGVRRVQADNRLLATAHVIREQLTGEKSPASEVA